MACVIVLFLALSASVAVAEEEALPDFYAAGLAALEAGRYEDAIAQYEAFADRMPSHPDASYNRGLAYVMRVRNDAEKPGDLGQAAAAFEEALLMRPDDLEAENALKLVQGEVARRRSRRGEDAVIARPTLDRVVVGLASETTWALAAVVASLMLAAGMVLRRKKEGTGHLAGVILLPLGAALLLVFLPLYLGARHLRLDTQVGVLVTRQAAPVDDRGGRLAVEPIPEAARLEVGERRGRLLHVRYGSLEGWLPADTVRLLRPR
ncbi:MAG: tetratricopeptide repeat protein [Polyangiaceae bacterium]